MTLPNDLPSFEDFEEDPRAFRETVASRTAAYEHRAVRQFMTWAGLGSQLPALTREIRDRTGQASLNFTFLASRVSGLPCRLGTSWYFVIDDKGADILLRDWHKRFSKLAIVQAHAQLTEETGGEEPVGIIFNWPSWSQFTILHNASFDLTTPGPRLIRVLGNATRDVFVIETCQQFCERLQATGALEAVDCDL